MGMFTNAGELFMSRLETAMGKEMQDEVLPEAKRRCPVRTGALRDSIEASVERDGMVVTGVLETDKPYAPFQEFGSHGYPGKAFMRGGAAVFDLERVKNRMKDGGE